MGLAVAAVAVIVILAAIIGFRRRASASGQSDVDLGSVTEGWLSDQRARKDS